MTIQLGIFDTSTSFVEKVKHAASQCDSFVLSLVRRTLEFDEDVEALIATTSFLTVDTEFPGFDQFVDRLVHQKVHTCKVVGTVSGSTRDFGLTENTRLDAIFSKRRTVTDLLVTIAMLGGPNHNPIHPPIGSGLKHASIPTTPQTLLSHREQEVFDLLAVGHSRAEIGERLQRSCRTVDSHRSNIMRKLRLRTNSDLVAFAVRMGRRTSST